MNYSRCITRQGTTAHVVMQLNAEDNGNRKFILVQIPEKTDEKSETFKAGYKKIFDITKARIEKVATQIQAENLNASGDSAFKIYKSTENFHQYQLNVDLLTDHQNQS